MIACPTMPNGHFPTLLPGMGIIIPNLQLNGNPPIAPLSINSFFPNLPHLQYQPQNLNPAFFSMLPPFPAPNINYTNMPIPSIQGLPNMKLSGNQNRMLRRI
jgi:hypothetical protein